MRLLLNDGLPEPFHRALGGVGEGRGPSARFASSFLHEGQATSDRPTPWTERWDSERDLQALATFLDALAAARPPAANVLRRGLLHVQADHPLGPSLFGRAPGGDPAEHTRALVASVRAELSIDGPSTSVAGPGLRRCLARLRPEPAQLAGALRFLTRGPQRPGSTLPDPGRLAFAADARAALAAEARAHLDRNDTLGVNVLWFTLLGDDQPHPPSRAL